MAVALRLDGQALVASYRSGGVYVDDMASGQRLLSAKAEAQPNQARFSSAAQYLAIAADGWRSVSVFDVGGEGRWLIYEALHGGVVVDFGFLPCDSAFVALLDTGEVGFWERTDASWDLVTVLDAERVLAGKNILSQKEFSGRPDGRHAEALALALSPDGKHLCIAVARPGRSAATLVVVRFDRLGDGERAGYGVTGVRLTPSLLAVAPAHAALVYASYPVP